MVICDHYLVQPHFINCYCPLFESFLIFVKCVDHLILCWSHFIENRSPRILNVQFTTDLVTILCKISWMFILWKLPDGSYDYSIFKQEKLHWWTILEQGDGVTNDLWNNSCSESIAHVSAMWVKWQMWRHLIRHKTMHQLMVITVLVMDLESHHLLQMRKSLGFHHLTTPLENLHLQFPELGRIPKPVPDFQEPYQPQHPQQCDQEILHLQGPVHILHHQIRNHQAQGWHVGVLAWDPEKGPKKLIQNFL
jgi:hypothetical protein